LTKRNIVCGTCNLDTWRGAEYPATICLQGRRWLARCLRNGIRVVTHEIADLCGLCLRVRDVRSRVAKAVFVGDRLESWSCELPGAGGAAGAVAGRDVVEPAFGLPDSRDGFHAHALLLCDSLCGGTVVGGEHGVEGG